MKSDQELMADFRNGDRPAFHKLIRRHHVAILNFFHPLTGSHAAAEELTQSTFLRIFGELEHQAESSLWGHRRSDDAQPFSTFLTYLYRTGYVCWLEYLRREGLPGVLPMPSSMTANVTLAAVCNEGLEPSGAIATLAILPNDLKPLVVLSEISRLSYADVAAVLNLSTSAVKLRLREAFALLRNARRENSTLAARAPAEKRSVPPESAAPGAAKV